MTDPVYRIQAEVIYSDGDADVGMPDSAEVIGFDVCGEYILLPDYLKEALCRFVVEKHHILRGLSWDQQN